MQRLFDFPQRGTPMLRKTIQRAELRERAQLLFRQRHAPLEIIQRNEPSFFSLTLDLFAVLLAQSVDDT